MRRREFITLLGGAAVAWPLAAHAQSTEGVRRLAVLMALPETDPEAKALLSEFTQGLAGLGWADGRNMRMDVRWAASNLDLTRKFAKELVHLQPDVILQIPHQPPLRFKTRHRQSQLYLRSLGTRLARALLPVCHTRVGTSLDWACLKNQCRASGSICSRRSHRASSGPHSCSIPTPLRISIHFLVPSFETAAEALKVAPSVAPVHSDAEIEVVITSLGREPKGCSPRRAGQFYGYPSHVNYIAGGEV